MTMEDFTKKVVDGVMAKLTDEAATLGLRPDTIDGLRQVRDRVHF